MPDEREMEDIHDAMKPPESSSLPRAERRRIYRDQPPANRFTGIKRCEWCQATVELDREPVPERCDACGMPYPEEGETVNVAGDTISSIATISVARRQASAVESVAGSIDALAEGVNRLADVFGEIGEAIAQRIGKAGR